MKRVATHTTGFLLLALFAIMACNSSSETQTEESVEQTVAEASAVPETDQIVVYYLHMNRRCMTCEKLEAYSQEAVEAGFVEQLEDNSIVWRIENFEEEGNEHFAEHYQLFSQSVILSRLHDGEETEWKNLDKIWELVGDEEKYFSYVQSEVKSFINPTVEE